MNSLDLHVDFEVVLPYKIYPGEVQGNLSTLLLENRHPMGASDFIKRLKRIEVYPEVLERWNNLCPTLADAIVVHPYGSIRVIRCNARLWNIIANSKLHEGVIELKGNRYDALGGAHILGMQILNYRRKRDDLRNVFSYLDISPKNCSFCLPKVRDYPYLTLLAFNHSAKVLGASRLDENGYLIGVR